MKCNSLTPNCVFEEFAKINKIPRPSKHEEKIREYLVNLGKELKLDTKVDKTGNVLITKPATAGMDNIPTVILQSHIDMVCDKLVDLDFDFYNDPIQTFIDGEWLKAKGTTLGADDGIGVAYEIAILKANDIPHGKIECLFTVDEETGLTGAFGLEKGWLTGKYLINMDSEDEGQIYISCAGGLTTDAIFTFNRKKLNDEYFFFQASVKGFIGGHSGDDINKKRANAIKVLARFLYLQLSKTDLRLAEWNSGKMDNAIPRDGKIIFAVPVSQKEKVVADWNQYKQAIREEYHVTDSNSVWSLESTAPQPTIDKDIAKKIICAIQAVDNGPLTNCQDEALSYMVETSSNIAVVETKEDSIKVMASQRSNVPSALTNIANTVKSCFELAGASITQHDEYPGWKMNPNSKLLEVAVTQYKNLFGKSPKVLGIHAGLECGLISEKYPNVDMISVGPTLRFVHTPDERLLIPTVEKVWNLLLSILKNIQ